MEATYDRVIEDPALRAKPWDVRVEPGAQGDAAARRLVRDEPGVEHATTITGLQVTTRAGSEIQARALGDGFERFTYAVPDGRMFAAPRRGDRRPRPLRAPRPEDRRRRSPCASPGRPFTVTLVGRHVEPDNDGEIVIFTAHDAARRPATARARDRRPHAPGPTAPRSRATSSAPRRRRRARQRRGAPGARRHPPDRLRLERAAGGRRAREPADDAAAGDPRARPRLRDPQGDRPDAARRARPSSTSGGAALG